MAAPGPAVRYALAAGVSMVEAVALAREHGNDLAAIEQAIRRRRALVAAPTRADLAPRPIWDVLADMHRQG